MNPTQVLPVEKPFVIRESKSSRQYPMYLSGWAFDDRGVKTSFTWSSVPDTAERFEEDWANYNAGHFNRQAWLNSTGYVYEVVPFEVATADYAAYWAALEGTPEDGPRTASEE